MLFWERPRECAAIGRGRFGWSPVIDVADGHTGHLDDSHFYGVDQRKIGGHPRKERAFGIARAAQEERCGGEVIYSLHANLGFHSLAAGNPDASFFLRAFGLDAVIAGEHFVFAVGFSAIAVMGFLVEDDDVLLTAQFAADTTHHLVRRFGEWVWLPIGEKATS
jgi:hypothetical protein